VPRYDVLIYIVDHEHCTMWGTRYARFRPGEDLWRFPCTFRVLSVWEMPAGVRFRGKRFVYDRWRTKRDAEAAMIRGGARKVSGR
jgi:hypothetical protein